MKYYILGVFARVHVDQAVRLSHKAVQDVNEVLHNWTLSHLQPQHTFIVTRIEMRAFAPLRVWRPD